MIPYEEIPEIPATLASFESSEEFARALLNILDDASAERQRLFDSQKAVVNILEDFSLEKIRFESTQKAILNILDDSVYERDHLSSTQKAILNILDDFEVEKSRAEGINVHLRREIFERSLAERALSEKGLALTRSNSELEQFAYVASHDLQEPLRMVSSYVQLLAEKYGDQLEPQAQKYIYYAVDGVKRMHSLIGALLEFSRIGRDEDLGRIDIREAVEHAISNLRSTIEASKAEIIIGNLPIATADLTQLAQVFQNLIGNAIKFANPDSSPRIEISSVMTDHHSTICVADNGIGIEPRHAERIFMIFQRLHDRSRYPGTGIGLAICKKVIERFQGQIWFETNERGGSKFLFTLPANSKL